MKPIVKLCLAASGILFLLGVVGIGAGAAMGVTPSELLYAGHYPGRFPSQAIQGLPILETADPPEEPELEQIPLEIEQPEFPLPSGFNPTDRDIYYAFQDVDRLELDLGLCELTIYRHGGDHIAVAADNTQSYFTCDQKGTSLLLKDDRYTSFKQDSMRQALILDLYLPAQEFSDVKVDLGAGNVTLVALSADTLEIDCGAGNVDLGALSCGKLYISAGVGDLTADRLLISEKADIEVGTGTATIAHFDGPSLELDCGVGNAQITAAGREQDYDYRLEAALGCIYLNHHQQEHPGHHHGFHEEDDDTCLEVSRGAGRQIDILCALGTAELNFTEE